MMVEHDMELAKQERMLTNAGHSVVVRGVRMDKDSRIFVAGHRGLVGSAIVRKLVGEGYRNLILQERSRLDLRRQARRRAIFRPGAARIRISCGGNGGWHPGKSDQPCGFHL